MAKQPKPPEKILISERVAGSYIDLEGDLDAAINALIDQKKFIGQYESLYLDSIEDCSCYYPCNCRPRLTLMGRRMETDKEFAKRVADEAARWKAAEARDRAQYEALAKRFGK
jgi:hypothetical protein